MPFGLLNAGSSFCCLMEQCLGDQQFVTLLLYLNDICIFAPTINDMLDRIELVFDRLKQYNLKIKPKKCQFFDTSILFLGHILLAKGTSANPEKVEKVKTWPVPKNIKEVQSFLGLALYSCGLLINLPRRHDAFTSLLVQHLTSIGKPGLRGKRITLVLLTNLNQELLNDNKASGGI